MGNETWSGNERRSIPVEVLNYVDARLEAHLEKVQEAIAAHNAHSAQLGREAEARHEELTRQLTVFMGHQELINTAFLRDHNGNPDYLGHHADHLERKTRAETLSQWWSDTLKKIGTGAIYSLFVVIGLVIWEAFKTAVKQ